jgi:hypothetical protein
VSLGSNGCDGEVMLNVCRTHHCCCGVVCEWEPVRRGAWTNEHGIGIGRRNSEWEKKILEDGFLREEAPDF